MRLLPLLLLTACYTQDAYVDTIGADYCARLRTCDRAEFDGLYTNVKDCKAEWRDVWDNYDTCLTEAGCTFDPKEAAACGAAIRKADCTEVSDGSWAEACLDIYACDAPDLLEAAFCSIGF
jgi:hypothetical protein